MMCTEMPPGREYDRMKYSSGDFFMERIIILYFGLGYVLVTNKSRYYSVQLETIMLKFPIKD